MSTTGAPKAQAANPFAQTAVHDLDHDDVVDVAALHSDARQLLLRGLRQAGRGFGQLMALVGDPGSGKSHLLWWLKRQHRPESLVVSIPALPDLAQPFRFTLKQLVSGLCRLDKKGSVLERPIDRLLWDVIYAQTYDLLDAARVGMYQGPTAVLKQLGPLCLDGGRKRALADFAEAAQKVWPQIEPGLRSYLLTLPTENSLDATARQVIVQFPYADRRSLVTAWLAGEDLAQKDRERIGAKQTINQEATARYVLCSLIRLASVRRPASVSILFDQADQILEQLGQPGLHALADVLGSLHGLGAATLIILSCRPDTFGQFSEKQARPGPSQIKQSMELISLARVNPPLLREVVTARLKSVSGSATSGLAPLSESDLGFLHEVDTPRAALSRLASVYSERSATAAPQSAAKPVADAKAATTAKNPTASKPAAAKVEAVSKSTDATKPVVMKPASSPASAAKATADAKPAADAKAAPVAKSPIAKSPIAKSPAVKSSDSATTPVRQAATEGNDALAVAMAEAQAGAITVENQRSLTHIDKSGPNVQREGKPGSASSAVSKQRDASAPVSRADSGDTVRRVPDESLLAKTRDAVLKAGPAKTPEPTPAKTPVSAPAKAVVPSVKPAQPEPAKATPAPAKPAATVTPAAKAAPAQKPAAAPVKKSEPVAKPEPARAPSADTPSRAWLDMAGDNDPLADAIAAARAELGASLSSDAAKPIKARPVEPIPKGAAKLIPTDFEPTRQIVVPVGEKGGFPDFSAVVEPSKTEMTTAPSADSPSVSWLAMAAEENPFGSSDPAPAKPTARPVRGTAAMGVVVVKPAAAKAASQGVGGPVAASRGPRSTQARIAAVPVPSGGTISPQRILAMLEGRSSMPEWQLAEELGVSIDNLSDHLNRMSANGQVRLVPSEDGRMVVPL